MRGPRERREERTVVALVEPRATQAAAVSCASMAALYRTALSHRCRRCRAAIAPGSVVIDRTRAIEEVASWVYHPACLIDVDPADARRALDPEAVFVAYALDGAEPNGAPRFSSRQWRGAEIALPERDALFALADERVRRTQALVQRARDKRRKKMDPSDARLARDEITRDARGCPRVSLHFAFFGRDARGSDLSAKVLIDATIRSQKREYVLAEARAIAEPELPWQPFVGALCLWASGVELGRDALAKLSLWKAHGVATPAFVVLGARSAQRDRCEQRARWLLDQAGFSADRALVCFAETLTDESVDALGERLDEHVQIEGARVEPVIDAREGAVALLESALRDERVDAYATALETVKKRVRGMPVELTARAANLAVRALAHPPARKAALALIEALPPASDVSGMRALWLELYLSSATMSSFCYALYRQLVRAEDRATTYAIAERLMREPRDAAATEIMLNMIHACPDRALSEPLQRWGESLADDDPRKALVLRSARYLLAAPRR